MHKRCLLSLALLFSLTFSAAHADTTTYQVSFSSDTDYGTAGATYLITFDPTLTYLNATTGFQIVTSFGAFHDTPTSNSGFNYDPTSENGLLTIGGLNDGSVADLNDIDDSMLSIGNFATASPVFHDYFYNDGPTASEFSSTGTVTEIAATPEPSSLMLLGTGLLGVVGCTRRRCAV